MTLPPAYRKVNPADAPVLLLAMTSPSVAPSDLQDYRRAPDLADAVDDRRRRPGQHLRHRSASRCGCASSPMRWRSRNISLDELSKALAAANVEHAGRHARGPAPDADAAGQQAVAQRRRLRRADRRQQPRRQPGAAEGHRRRRGQRRDAQDLRQPERRAVDLAGILRQPGANTVRVVDAVKAVLADAPVRRCRNRSHMSAVNDRSVSVREALHDVTLTLMGTIALVVLVIFLFLRRFVATMIPTLSLPVSLVGAVALLWAPRLQPRQHLAARPDAGRRPGRRRRDRDAREHHPPRRGTASRRSRRRCAARARSASRSSRSRARWSRCSSRSSSCRA